MDKKISIAIASYNMSHTIEATIDSIMEQSYPNKEIIFYDDCSTDNTAQKIKSLQDIYSCITYYRGEVNKGVGEGFNEAMAKATGDYIVLMCADDLFTDRNVLKDIAFVFDTCPTVGHVSRWYHQFVDGYPGAVRAWRGHDPIVLANNPSGLAFRREAIQGKKCSNHMFIETSFLVHEVLKKWKYHILSYDTIAVRVHASTSTQKGYWLKRRVSSPVADWVSIGGKEILKDYCSLIQIKCNFTTQALLEEIDLYIKLRPTNILNPRMWFFIIIALLTPRFLLRKIPLFYRHRISRYFTKEVKR